MRAFRRSRDPEVSQLGKVFGHLLRKTKHPDTGNVDSRHASVEPWISEYLIRLVSLIIYTNANHSTDSGVDSILFLPNRQSIGFSAVDRIEVAFNQFQ